MNPSEEIPPHKIKHDTVFVMALIEGPKATPKMPRRKLGIADLPYVEGIAEQVFQARLSARKAQFLVLQNRSLGELRQVFGTQLLLVMTSKGETLLNRVDLQYVS